MRHFPRSTPSRLARSLTLGLVALLFTACTEQADDLLAPSPPSPQVGLEVAPGLQDFGPAIRAVERYTPRLMQNPGVVGTGVAVNAAGRPTVRLFLVHGNVPNLPVELDGVPVSREVTGLFTLRQDRTARARPAPIGFSVGHPDITAGTLGARVTDGTRFFILSNNHVMANSNNANIGDPILQPGAYDGGSEPGDVIGTLYDFEPISFSSNNTMDAAIAVVNGDDVSGSTPSTAGYGAPSTTIVSPSVGMGVQKYGRTTGHTFGTVEETNVTVSICFATRGPFNCVQSATFVGQFTITDGSFSDGGDSGSLIVTSSGANPVGLLFAGSSTRTIANPIGVVLNRFGVSIDPGVGGGDGGGTGDPGPGDGVLSIEQFNVSTRTQGPWRRADVSWSVAHSGAGLASVTSQLISGSTVLDQQSTSLSGSSASGIHELRSRSTPDTVRIIVTDAAGNQLTEDRAVSY